MSNTLLPFYWHCKDLSKHLYFFFLNDSQTVFQRKEKEKRYCLHQKCEDASHVSPNSLSGAHENSPEGQTV